MEDSPLITRATQTIKLCDLGQRVADNGCVVNLSFAIDGSKSVTSAQFVKQKQFVDAVIDIITDGKPKNYCAVQYGTSVGPISPLDSRKRELIWKQLKAKQFGVHFYLSDGI